ncbi:hypothetical protein KDA_33790 [Dictyobacter alpinus]|uniref:Uncharacterized protein n=1 Tax=Dictyobacter alpinus TaxID=2014873 RepID=A0A402B975_9CHLR|nr:hypothetical protein [Dictyobacter alpinus]GCE27895.1 hypothetical protein KDA_33790 [Dictyobacter alpinus]
MKNVFRFSFQLALFIFTFLLLLLIDVSFAHNITYKIVLQSLLKALVITVFSFAISYAQEKQRKIREKKKKENNQ